MTDTKNRTIPWVEKYRPTNFDEIVLSETNKEICKNIVTTGYVLICYFMDHPELVRQRQSLI